VCKGHRILHCHLIFHAVLAYQAYATDDLVLIPGRPGGGSVSVDSMGDSCDEGARKSAQSRKVAHPPVVAVERQLWGGRKPWHDQSLVHSNLGFSHLIAVKKETAISIITSVAE